MNLHYESQIFKYLQNRLQNRNEMNRINSFLHITTTYLVGNRTALSVGNAEDEV
jgi:hypothetical protein